jgi:hypothetical protein
MEDKNKQLSELRPEDLPLQEIEKRTLMFPKILELAIQNTTASDWIDFGGNPWLDTPGSERLARVFGLTVKEATHERIDRHDGDGDYYFYVWRGKVGLAKADIWIDAVGACSSRKPFHAMEHGKRKHLEDINEMNILKDAYSNLIENGVTRFLGLRGLDWETLEKAGIERKKVSRVDFKGKGTKAPNPPGMPNPEPPGPAPIPDQPPTMETAPPKEKTTDKTVNPKTRESLIDYAVSRVLATREQIAERIRETLTQKQCNYILTNLAKLQGDVKLDVLEDIVRGAVFTGGA